MGEARRLAITQRLNKKEDLIEEKLNLARVNLFVINYIKISRVWFYAREIFIVLLNILVYNSGNAYKILFI